MATQPVLIDFVQDAEGNKQTVAVAVRELGGGTIDGTLWDEDGDVTLAPTSDNNGGVYLTSNYGDRLVELTPAGATSPRLGRFQGDPTTRPLWVTDFAGQDDITTGVNSAYDAVMRALDRADTTGQKHVSLPPGTFLTASTIVLPDGVWFDGAGMGLTTFKHANNSANSVLLASTSTGVLVENFSIDGNYSNNHDPLIGFTGLEMYCAGTGNMFRNLSVTNFNGSGFEVSGVDCYYENLRATGPDVTVASYPLMAGGSLDARSIYGMFCNGVSTRNVWVGMRATRTRSAGIYIGGTDCALVAPVAWNCHRGHFPDGVGGGQIAVSIPTGGTQRLTIDSPHVGAADVASVAYTTGIEVGGGGFVTIIAPQITGQTGSGISVTSASAVKVSGGTINACALYGVAVDSALFFELEGTHFQSNATAAIILAGTTDYARIIAPSFLANAADVQDTTGVPPFTQTIHNRVFLDANGTAIPATLKPVTVSVAASAADTLVDTTYTDVTGAVVTVVAGQYVVTVGFAVARDATANDAASIYQAKIVAGTATASIDLPTSLAEFGPIAATAVASTSQTWTVTVTVGGTLKMQARKVGGTGTSGIRIPQTTLTAVPVAGS